MTQVDRLVVFSIPMRWRFRQTDVRQGVLVHGPAGWGEFSPFPGYGPEAAASWWHAAREAACDGFPAAVRDVVAVNTTVPAVGPDDAATLVARSGCQTAKVKVAEPGQRLADDVDRVAAVRDVLGPRGKVRIDANGAWDVQTAVLALARLARYDLEYAEQPCASLGELAELRRRTDVLIAADESIRLAADPIRAAASGAMDVVVVKVQPLGGVRPALAVAEAAGVPAVVSSALETSVGLAAGVALAAALPELPYACGLGTATLLAGDVVLAPLEPQEGMVAVRRPEPDVALLTQHAPDPETASAWLDRLAAADAAAGAPHG